MKVRSVWALLWLPLACACSPAGDNGQRGDDVEQGPVDSVVGLKPLPPSLTFHLNYKPEKDWSKCAERDVVVFDMFDSSEADFAKCSELGALTLCYFSSQYEDWRSDSGELPSEALYSAVETRNSAGERVLWIASRAGLLIEAR